MIDNPAAGFSYLPLALSRNLLVFRQPAPSPQLYPNRALLRFRLRLWVQPFYRSTTFSAVTPLALEASELPPGRFGNQTVYRGAPFELQDLLDSNLNLTPPLFDQRYISTVEGLTRQYYTDRTVLSGVNTILTEESAILWAIKAGIKEADYEFWATRLFTDPAARAGKFLTWQPDHKPVRPDQPEYLFFLVNQQPAPTQLRLRVQFTYEDSTNDMATILTQPDINPMTVYCVPVGPLVVGVATRPKVVRTYAVWLSDVTNARWSEVRTYRMDNRAYAQCRYILFNNSLGGFDTLCLTGQRTETLQLERGEAERPTDIDGRAMFAERIVTEVEALRELVIHTGYLSIEARTWLAELHLARQVYLITDRTHLALMNRTEEYMQEDDGETLIGRQLTFVYSNTERNHSVLPTPSPATIRPTNWVAYQTACEINANGLRTGRSLTVLKRLVFTDTGQPVEPEQIALNLPGEAGYVAPVASGACANTPFVNDRISKQGTFYRSNCPGSQVGGAALIVVDAGLFGSEFSQADADAKAQAYWESLNTASRADQYGSCTVGTYQSAQISQYGSFYRNSCTGGQVGQKALIVIPAGAWGSNISQADADQKAQQQWTSLNTQATANTQATCVAAARQVGSRTSSGSTGGPYITFTLTRNGDNSYTLTYDAMFGHVCKFYNLPAGSVETTQVGGTPGGTYTTSVSFPASLFGVTPHVDVAIHNGGSGAFGSPWLLVDTWTFKSKFH